MVKKIKHQELKVAFDTSAIHTKLASDLFNSNLALLIQEKSNLPDLTISWHIPEVVILERKYQMEQGGIKLPQQLHVYEKLFGHKLGITEESIKSKIANAIEEQIKKSSIDVISLNADQVDWQEIIVNSTSRYLPFDPNKNEKGFRDALIGECFLQLINKTPKTCIIALVIHDPLLQKHIKNKTQALPNVRIYSDIEELESLINTLTSSVSETHVNKLILKAEKYFNNKNSFFNNKNITKIIFDKFNEQIRELPSGSNARSSESWIIGDPRFVKKSTQRITWMTAIILSSTVYNIIPLDSSISVSPMDKSPVTSVVMSSGKRYEIDTVVDSSGAYQYHATKTKVATGMSIFKLFWSVRYTSAKKFTYPKIEDIQFIENKWTYIDDK